MTIVKSIMYNITGHFSVYPWKDFLDRPMAYELAEYSKGRLKKARHG
jgi:hypothetical protein